MIHKIFASLSALVIIFFVLSPFVLVVQVFLSLLYLFLMLTGVGIIIGVPTIIIVKLLLNKSKLNRVIKELVVAIITILILFLWQFLVSDLYPPEVIKPSYNLMYGLYLSFIYLIISRICYLVFMTSYNEFYLKRRYARLALITLISNVLLFLLACAAQWRLYTDPYIF